MATILSGTCDPAFFAVREALAANFADRGELGASVCVIVGGRTVVDLWGGIADHRVRRAWGRDTLVTIFSSTKGATALCAHLLVACGRLDLDAPVARYWPEFAAAGKEDIPVRWLLNHQAGLCGVDQPLPAAVLYDWERLTGALAAQAPLWPPGTAHGYHASTFGFLVGEVVRRVSGVTIGQFLRNQICGPRGIDLWIGLPESEEGRVALTRMPPPAATPSPLFGAMMQRGSLTWKAFMNPRGLLSPTQTNTRQSHAAELPSSNGIANGRSLAGLYNSLRGADALVDAATLAAMSTVESQGPDLVLLTDTRFTAGFMKTMANGRLDSARFGPNDDAIGHAGAGGSFGMFDPRADVAIGYAMNQMGPGILLNDRGQSLIDATYDALGASRN